MNIQKKRASIKIIKNVTLKKINFEQKFLHHLFPSKNLNLTYLVCTFYSIGLTKSDYLYVTNGDRFNTEIKSLSDGRYIETSMYTAKKDITVLTDSYCKKQTDVTSNLFKQESVSCGKIIYLCKLFLEKFSFLAAVTLKDKLSYEYLTLGKQMRGNLDYELLQAKKQKQIDYKALYDSTTYK